MLSPFAKTVKQLPVASYDENGAAVSRELYLGKYEVREITATHGLVLNPEPHCVELAYAGQNVAVTETATSFENERQKVEISLVKSIEQNERFDIGNNGEMKNISFGLFAAEEIVSASGTSIPADGLIEIISLNEDGTAAIKTDLPLGSYYVQELATDIHYKLSDTKYLVTFAYAGQDTAVVKIAANDGKAMQYALFFCPFLTLTMFSKRIFVWRKIMPKNFFRLFLNFAYKNRVFVLYPLRDKKLSPVL